MSFWKSLTGGFEDLKESDFGKFLTSDAGSALSGIAGSLLLNKFAPGFMSPQSQPTGYQGEIPRYAAIRERVPMPERQPVPEGGIDPNRRPGSSGRRYFSDTIFAKQPKTEPMSIEAARKKAQEQAKGIASAQMAQGGILAMSKDEVPARIDSGQEARLSDGEFVIPADVVSHLGNGNSEAGAKVLHGMMNRVRKERTGNEKQGKEIKPERMLPA